MHIPEGGMASMILRIWLRRSVQISLQSDPNSDRPRAWSSLVDFPEATSTLRFELAVSFWRFQTPLTLKHLSVCREASAEPSCASKSKHKRPKDVVEMAAAAEGR